jgi:hypothetical protein
VSQVIHRLEQQAKDDRKLQAKLQQLKANLSNVVSDPNDNPSSSNGGSGTSQSC